MSLLTRPVILASGSAYRAQLLRDAGVVFTVRVSHVDEEAHPLSEPANYATSLATLKAHAVAALPEIAADQPIVIGADTVCAIGHEIIGKPADEADARRMIARACAAGLQRVITGVCVVDTRDGSVCSFSETSLVDMGPADEEEIAAYVASGEPMGKCGALCIESGRTFVRSWRGSYANIMGLPNEQLIPLLLKLDVT